MTQGAVNIFEDGDKRWVALWGAIAGLLAGWAARVPLGGVAHVSDEVAYTLQARLFAAGMRVGPAADNSSMLMYPFWTTEPASYSPFPPGWPALLASGERIGVPWLVNPLLVMFIPLVIWRLTLRWSDRRTARLAVMIFALSPGVWLMAASRMAHTSVLLALGLIAVVAVERPSAWRAWAVGGVAAGYIVLARPFDALLLAAPLLLIGLAGTRRWVTRLAWGGAPALAAVALLLDNQLLTGEWWSFPMNDWFDAWRPDRQGCNRLGFGAEIGCAPTLGSFGHTPLKALKLTWTGLLRLDSLLLGVPGGLLLAIWGARKLSPRWPWLIAAALLLAYSLYWSPGRAYGARFYHPLMLILPIAIATTLRSIALPWAWLGIAAITVAGGSRVARDLADRYWCVDNGLVQLLAANGVEDGVVFLRAKGKRAAAWPVLGVDSFECDPLLESGDGLQLNDPAYPSAGLRVRHALQTTAQMQAFVARHHPGSAAWLITHDVAKDRRTIARVGSKPNQ